MVLNNIMKKYKQQGFTLLELMVVVAMLGVVTAIGLPSFRSTMITSEIVDVTNDFTMTLKRARSEAIKRGKDVRICSSTDGKTCSGVAGKWVEGWLIYDDIDADGQVDEGDGELIWVKEMDSNTQLTIIPTNVAFDDHIDYSYIGSLAGGLPAGFNICSGYGAEGYPQREITISVSGDSTLKKNTAVKC